VVVDVYQDSHKGWRVGSVKPLTSSDVIRRSPLRSSGLTPSDLRQTPHAPPLGDGLESISPRTGKA
jgi:hypothetical protein